MLVVLAKRSYCEDPEVRSLIEAGTESVKWVRQEFSGIDLGDKRLDRRLIKTAELLAKSPLSPINEACGNWADAQAAYRLFDNGEVSPAGILDPHVKATLKRVAELRAPVLVVQDSVFFYYGRHPKTKGLGPISKNTNAHDRGLCMHNALAFTTSGVPLGLLSQIIWARREVPDEEHHETIERLSCTAIEEKESFKWLRAMRETLEHTSRELKFVTVADRESDFWEFISEATQEGARFLLRARIDRKLVAEESEGCESIIEALASAEVLGSLRVNLSGNSQRKTRTAEAEVRVTQVTIKPPFRRGQAKASASIEPVRVKVIAATERDPPAGEEAVSWVLLTNLPVPDFTSAGEKIQWYSRRFGIETWHRVLKSGCKVEDCLLQTADRLKRYLTIFSIIGIRLMHVGYLARVQPDTPATEVFSIEEIEALNVRVNSALPLYKSPSLREAVRMIGSLGGHLGRKCDGEPGMTVLWRGWMRLHEAVLTLRAHKTALGLA